MGVGVGFRFINQDALCNFFQILKGGSVVVVEQYYEMAVLW